MCLLALARPRLRPPCFVPPPPAPIETAGEFDVEEARLWGGNRSAALWAHRQTPANPTGDPYALVDLNNSIVNRLDAALVYAAAHATAGSGRWTEFRVAGSAVAVATAASATPPTPPTPPSGQTIAWAKVVLSGWSRGSAYVTSLQCSLFVSTGLPPLPLFYPARTVIHQLC